MVEHLCMQGIHARSSCGLPRADEQRYGQSLPVLTINLATWRGGRGVVGGKLPASKGAGAIWQWWKRRRAGIAGRMGLSR